jgi:hypothetical protein
MVSPHCEDTMSRTRTTLTLDTAPELSHSWQGSDVNLYRRKIVALCRAELRDPVPGPESILFWILGAQLLKWYGDGIDALLLPQVDAHIAERLRAGRRILEPVCALRNYLCSLREAKELGPEPQPEAMEAMIERKARAT